MAPKTTQPINSQQLEAARTPLGAMTAFEDKRSAELQEVTPPVRMPAIPVILQRAA